MATQCEYRLPAGKLELCGAAGGRARRASDADVHPRLTLVVLGRHAGTRRGWLAAARAAALGARMVALARDPLEPLHPLGAFAGAAGSGGQDRSDRVHWLAPSARTSRTSQRPC